MKISIKKLSVSLLIFTFIICAFFYLDVYADSYSGYVDSNNTLSGSDIGSAYSNNIGYAQGSTKYNFSTIVSEIKKDIIKDYKDMYENDFTGSISLPSISIKYHTYSIEEDSYGNKWVDVSDTSTTTYCNFFNIGTKFKEIADSAYSSPDYSMYIEFTLNNETQDKYYIYTKGNNYVYIEDGDVVTYTAKQFSNSSHVPSTCINKDGYSIVYENTCKILEYIQKTAKEYLIACAIPYGYNVGTMYSTKQIPLTDAMHEADMSGTYDFENLSIFKQSFNYYINPILGKIEYYDEDKDMYGKSVSIDKWIDFVDKHSLITYGSTISVNSEFKEFIKSLDLSGERINEEGLKVSKSKFNNGICKVTGISVDADGPNSVLSYMVKLAFPYIFVRVGDTYMMDNQSMRVEGDYTYCLYNNRIFDTAGVLVTDIGSIGISRDKLYLYNHIVSEDGTNREGVVIFGEYEECVYDTTLDVQNSSALLATGRKVGFNNAYSDKLDINNANSDIMYTLTDSANRIGYLPKNVLFLPTEDEQIVSKDNYLVNPEARTEGVQKLELLDSSLYSKDNMHSQVGDINNHISFENNPNFIKVWIIFENVVNKKGASNSQISLSDSDTLQSSGLSHYGAYIIRNNRYVYDSDLLSWLSTNAAKGKSYVDTETLIEKITGDFRSGFDKITYEDWLKMQDIKGELMHDKDNTIVRIFNVMCIIMGTFLIIFSILMCLFYWVDIFNTFTRFSLLNYISMKRLYPIEHKDLVPMDSSDGVKYVTFKDVLILAFICMAIGIVFLEAGNLISLIIKIFNYLVFTLRG